MNRRLSICGAFLLLVSSLLYGCPSSIRSSHGPCRIPTNLEPSEIVGTWTARYDDPWISGTRFAPAELKTGVETLTFSVDGTYTHTFTSVDYEYRSQPEHWSIDNSSLDSPKLKMEKMRYFALGTLEPKRDIRLMPEMPDKIRYQDAGIDPTPVYYPSSGFVYLYLRACWGGLVMQQMVDGYRDPDNITFINPAFRRE
jgi:hypothetical protein